MSSSITRACLFALLGLALSQLILASAAANSVPPTHLDGQSRTVSVADLAAECRGRLPGALVVGDGLITGSAADELILGGPGDDTIDGGGGDDCILAGGGDDTISGGPGDDLCLAGAGNDTIGPDCEDS